jgi:hypothetical protein
MSATNDTLTIDVLRSEAFDGSSPSSNFARTRTPFR